MQKETRLIQPLRLGKVKSPGQVDRVTQAFVEEDSLENSQAGQRKELFRLTLIPLHFDTKLSVVWPIIY
jgi:hypothetical protein